MRSSSIVPETDTLPACTIAIRSHIASAISRYGCSSGPCPRRPRIRGADLEQPRALGSRPIMARRPRSPRAVNQGARDDELLRIPWLYDSVSSSSRRQLEQLQQLVQTALDVRPPMPYGLPRSGGIRLRSACRIERPVGMKPRRLFATSGLCWMSIPRSSRAGGRLENPRDHPHRGRLPPRWTQKAVELASRNRKVDSATAVTAISLGKALSSIIWASERAKARRAVTGRRSMGGSAGPPGADQGGGGRKWP